MKICPGCGTLNEDKNTFCIGCNEKIEGTFLFCSHCGNKVASSNKFCKVCGSEIGKSEAEILQEPAIISQGNSLQKDFNSKTQTSEIPKIPEKTQTSEIIKTSKKTLVPIKKKKPYKKLVIALSIFLPVFFISLALALVFSISELPSTKQAEIKAEMSADQKRVIKLFGYPDQFLIMFDESNNNNRQDLWTYSEMETIFIFENGFFDSTKEYYNKVVLEGKQKVFPDNFIFGMTPDEVKALISKESVESIDEVTGLKVLTFDNGGIICVFNPNDKLIIVSKQLKLSEDV
jgi:hypothetical protein